MNTGTQVDRERSMEWWQERVDALEEKYGMGVISQAEYLDAAEVLRHMHQAWCSLMDAYDGLVYEG